MYRLIIIATIVIAFFFLLRYYFSLDKVPAKKKTTILDYEEEDMKISGNAYQCPLCKGEYVFYNLYKAVENDDEHLEKLYRAYIAFNDLKLSATELDREEFKHNKV